MPAFPVIIYLTEVTNMNMRIVIYIITGIILQALFIKTEHEEKYVAAVILKGLASLCFVLIGYYAFTHVNNALTPKIFYGLAFGMLGDILLNLRFVFREAGQKIFLIGILAFLIGHILYLVALIGAAQHVWIWYCIIIGGFIAAALLAYIFRTMEVKKAFKIFGVFYLGAVIIMTCIAIGIAVFMPSKASLMFAVGAVLFTLSDIVLIFITFSGTTRFSLRITNLSLYYLGQVLIACSLLF